MNRRRGVWIAATALALLVAGGLLGRAGLLRKAPVSTPAAAAVAMELTPGDLARAERSELVSTLAISGSLKAFNSALVKARVAAEIRELNVREGDAVQAGQLLGRLDATEYAWRLRQAEDQAAAAQAQLEIAQRTLDNNKALVNQGFISKNALDTSASSAAGALASLQAARAAAEIARKAVHDSEIRAPIGGLIAQRLAQPGERVGVDARLLEIVDLAQLELEAAVAPEDVLTLRVGQSARLRIDGLAQDLPARVVRINPSAQSGTRSVLAYLRVDPHPGLRQGLFARGSIDLERRSALVLPLAALRHDQALPYVLTVEDGVAVQRSVGLGRRGQVLVAARLEDAVEITQGLAEGSVVLRDSVGVLRAGTRLKLPATSAPAAPAAAPLTTRPAASAAER